MMKRNQAANVMTACVWAAAAMLLFPGPGRAGGFRTPAADAGAQENARSLATALLRSDVAQYPGWTAVPGDGFNAACWR